MDAPITRIEHEEFTRRIEAENKRLSDEDKRQNRRIDDLEAAVREMHSLAASVEKLAINMQNMLKSQEQQGERLERLESRDGEMWRQATGYIITTILGAVIGFVFMQMGM